MLYALGDLQNEESVLEWLIDDDNRELADEIESVNERMLERLLDESPFLAVFFCTSVNNHYRSLCSSLSAFFKTMYFFYSLSFILFQKKLIRDIHIIVFYFMLFR